MAKIRLIKNKPDQSVDFTYTLGNFQRFSYMINTPVTPAPLPEEDSSQNVLVKIEGNSSVINLTWIIKNFEETQVSSTDTPTREVKTIADHLTFFRDDFASVSIEDSFKLEIDFNDVAPDETGYDGNNKMVFNGTITKIGFNMTGTSPVILTATTNFIEGTVIAIYDLDVPSEPLNVKATVINNTIKLEWDPPITKDDVTITGYRIRARKIDIDAGGYFTLYTAPANATSFTSGSLPDDTYRIEIAALSDNGVGIFNTSTKVVMIDTS